MTVHKVRKVIKTDQDIIDEQTYERMEEYKYQQMQEKLSLEGKGSIDDLIDTAYVPNYYPLGTCLIVKSMLQENKKVDGLTVNLKEGKTEGGIFIASAVEAVADKERFSNTYFEVFRVGSSCFLRPDQVDMITLIKPGVRIYVESHRQRNISTPEGKPSLYFHVDETYIRGIHEEDIAVDMNELRDLLVKNFLKD